MLRPALALLAVALTAGCGDGDKPSPRAPASERSTRDDAAATTVTDAPSPPRATTAADASGCPSPQALAIDHIEADLAARGQPNARHGYTEDSFENVDEQPDLDGDGTPDVVLVQDSGLTNVPHYFFVKRDDGCHELVGVISIAPLFGFSCRTTRTHGLCDLGVSRLMIHGETERATWVFDGTRYEQSGRAELGPRPPKFR